MPNEFLRNKLLIICGPTATGKTALAVKLAKKFNGEVISADSRQVYRGMDIGTGKDLPHRLEGIPIWLYDVAEPDQLFSAADYYRLAWRVIEDIWQRRKLPILVGGTGFYIKVVVEGIGSLGISPDWKLRKQLSNLAIEDLRKKLKELSLEGWEIMNESDRQNPRRLIRAIEIASKIGSSKLKVKSYNTKLKIKSCLFLGLTASHKALYARIDKRVERQMKMGAEGEVEKLLKKYRWENSVLQVTLGYQEWRPYFEKKSTREEVIERWKYDEHAYARRQMTWFKKEKRINWFDITQKEWENKVEKLISDWYTS